MEQGREGPLPHFFLQDRGAIGVGVAGVDDERQAGLASGGDMGAEHPPRDFARRMVVVVVEPRLAQPDAFRMPRERDEFLDRRLFLLMRVMRMRANGAENLRIGLRHGLDAVEARQMRRDGDHPPDAPRLCARDDLRLFGREIGEVEMAVSVDEHRFISGNSCRSWLREGRVARRPPEGIRGRR